MQGHKQIGGALYSLDIATGEAELLLDNWNGLRFNSPNDLVVRPAPIPQPSFGLSSAHCSEPTSTVTQVLAWQEGCLPCVSVLVCTLSCGEDHAKHASLGERRTATGV